AARASAGTLAIFDSAGDGAAAPLFESAGCTRLLAWSSERDRLSCFGERPGRSALSFFEIGASGLVELPEPSEGEARQLGDPSGSRRVLSSSGRWFALGAAEGLSVWSLESGRTRLVARVASAELGSVASTLAFSPDERGLLVGAGNRLWLLALDGEPRLVELSASALLDDACGERSVDAPESWCGSDSGSTSVRWSSGSDVVLFRSTLGTLTFVDVSAAGDGRVGEPITPDADCDEACLSGTTARFQP
ncbi:MAG TPA: hypothetical protein VNN80_01200, partial [Polyangiaceae bacterium]|nr:hypothetical protein [Polyangiaceae bacterium]